MGSFFTNVQLLRAGRLASAPRPAQVAAIADAIKQAALAAGFVEADPAGKADRTILVGGGDGDGRWLTIYDSATEDQDDKALDALASALSARLETSAVTVLVHDSDVLELRLFEAGKRADRYNNDPGYFSGRVSKKAAAEAAGHPERWSPLLGAGATAAQLRAIWGDEALPAESVLAKTADALGWDARLSGRGYRYTVAGDGEPGAETVLRLRLAVRTKAEEPLSGPPRFEDAGCTPSLDLSTGEPLVLRCNVRNIGGATRGLAIDVWGEAIDRGLVAASEVEVMVGLTPRRRGDPPVATAPLVAEAGVPGVRGHLAELELPAGHDVFDESARRLDPEKRGDLLSVSTVYATVKGAARAPGSGALHVGFVPYASPRDGQYAHTTSLAVRAPSRRPLRADAAVDAAALRALEPTDSLLALVSFDLERAAAAAHAADAIVKWSALLAHPRGSWSITVFRRSAGRVGTGSSKAKGFFASARWAKLRDEFAKEAQVTGALPVSGSDFDEDGHPDQHVHGFTFGTSMLPLRVRGDRELPTLALSLDLTGARADAAAALQTIVDDLMARAKGVQALMAHWAGVAGAIDCTPYETATGTGGECTLLASWQRRYLRGVGDGPLWLGPALLERLGERGPLERAAAAVQPVGPSLRVMPGPGPAALDALERALAPLLPDRDAWQRASRDL
jgi:hypothetical protein